MDEHERGKQLELLREQHALKVARNGRLRRRALLGTAAALLALWGVHVAVTEVPERLKELNNFVLQAINGQL